MSREEIDKMFEGRWRIKGNFGKINLNTSNMTFDEFYEYIKAMCKDFFEAGIILSSGTETTADKSIEGRAFAFRKELFSDKYTSKYPAQLLEDFYNYWTEPNRRKTKMRFEIQQTWDISRRLFTWSRNNFNRYDRQPTTDAASKLASILTP